MREYDESVLSLWEQYQASLQTVGVNNANRNRLNVFLQNGGNDLALIDLPVGANHVSISNITGCVLFNAEIINQKTALVNVEYLLPGIYVLFLENKGLINRIKFVK
ncbi:hypothetical protein SAMN05444274_10226 [Mariniphaga anaerophila]|uniref:Uncharacterized protein n=1 Tax=Mariniphaga anaerophila TaxID=1484053 RepID=A0A1M4V9A3_9BACT|nr:hypothetical protein [Mariniphaga anaerophila]SHE65467.1 hypothetical protein SAMN05444274_10226 [Mariniphaga anaerophila]